MSHIVGALPSNDGGVCVSASFQPRLLVGRSRLAMLSLVVLLLLTACSPPWRDEGSHVDPTACLASLSQSNFASEGVFVEPTDGTAPIIDELDHARCGIDVGIYLLTNNDVIAALERAAARGVRVRVIVERYPYGGSADTDALAARLDAAGIAYKWSDSRFRFTHAKYIVVDRQVAIVMNMNLTASAFKGNREFGAISTDATVVAEAQTLFDGDWDGNPADRLNGPLIVSPTNSRECFLDLIDQSQVSIDLYVEVINDSEIINTLGYAAQAGVRVRLIVNPPENDSERAIYAAMQRSGIEVRVLSRLYVHAKVMIVDGSTAIVGSQNFTPTSLDSNREIALAVTSAGSVERAAAVFAQDWAAAKPVIQ
ncbi:MAG: phospholipase D-like domain-containing protein [Thermomicrobiales bacterium]